MKKNDIKKLFYEILEKYRWSELQNIEEFSISDVAEDWLEEEVEKYQNQIDELLDT